MPRRQIIASTCVSSHGNVSPSKSKKSRGSHSPLRAPFKSEKSARKRSPPARERSTQLALKRPTPNTAQPSAPCAALPSANGGVTKQLWLMKTDPDYMLAGQVDKLVKDGETTWTGVRGYEARNLLRDHFRVGDQVLFYHSGVKDPGIAALCVVSKAAFPEAGAPLNSRGEVQWYSVGVRLVCTVSPQLSLQQLRAETSLAGMDLFLRSRLSIQRVEASHWEHIIAMAGLQKSAYFKK